jgi:hypothetical protein
MSLVRPVCASCGAKTEALAVVMDPFMDACYGVCNQCLSALHAQQNERIRESLAVAAEEEQA